ncbi:kinesin heavy chain-like isoform X2 [Dysidea avara]|uniref:kinesin heavy chain-like isoform X2 n=1 Tax=Dysidea avara TaxID=196820 RepID=UPI00331987BB
MDTNLVNNILRRLHALFRSCLNFQSISPQLRQHNLLTDHEWQVIKNKDSHEDQVDEFLQYLPHKGKDCLNQLIECLELSLDHAGHKDLLQGLKKEVNLPNGGHEDEFDQHVSAISNFYLQQKETIANLNKHIEKQDATIKQLQLDYDNHATQITQLNDTVSDQKSQIEHLSTQLREKDRWLSSPKYNSSIASFESAEVSSPGNDSAKASMLSVDDSYGPPPSLIHDDSWYYPDSEKDLGLSPPSNKHEQATRHHSIEDRLKDYNDKSVRYREMCEHLKEEKEELKQAKQNLEQEVHQLREQLDAVSIASHGSTLAASLRKPYSLSDSSLTSKEKEKDSQTERSQSERMAEKTVEPTVIGRITSYIKNPIKRSSRFIAPEEYANFEVPVAIPVEDYLNPVYQGWLTKEGGIKKNWKKRWCVLSSCFFFYFERKEDFDTERKKPIGILPLSKDMEVVDCRENLFEICNKSRANMKSCKLDKTTAAYVQGNHTVYNLQAPSDDFKKKWIEVFQLVFKNLNTE